MGERPESTLFQPTFNRAVRVEAARTELTEDTGALVLREAAVQLGLVGAIPSRRVLERHAPRWSLRRSVSGGRLRARPARDLVRVWTGWGRFSTGLLLTTGNGWSQRLGGCGRRAIPSRSPAPNERCSR